MRLFLALEMSTAARAELAALVRRLRPELGGWRWAQPDALHLTLRFLGEVSAAQDGETRAAWGAATAHIEPFWLTLAGLGCFPDRRRPRVLWVGVREDPDEGRLGALAAALERAARDRGFAPETRAFRPHLTLARAARGARPVAPADETFAVAERVAVRRLVLFRSALEPGGARYTALSAFPLAGVGAGETS